LKKAEKLRWGIIGCGDVTELKSGPAFNKIPHSELYAVMRRNGGKAKDYAQRHQVPVWYDKADALINDPEVNAIYIATPPSSHEQYTIAAIRAGKPVYVEKPMTTDSASARRISEAAREFDIKVSVAHYRRHLPLFLRIKQLLDTNYIGEVKLIQLRLMLPLEFHKPNPGNWRLEPLHSGGGLFHDLSPHQLDLMYYFFGVPVSVYGSSLNQAGYYEADDIVSGTLIFDKGIVMNGLWSFTVPETESLDSCEIIGSKGSLKFSIFKMHDLTISLEGRIEEVHFDVPVHVQLPMIEKVVEYFREQGPNPCSAEDGIEVMEMMDALTRKVPGT
jgi:predicted dehydrogenase